MPYVNGHVNVNALCECEYDAEIYYIKILHYKVTKIDKIYEQFIF